MRMLGPENELILIEVDTSEIVQTMFDFLEALMRGEAPAHSPTWIYARLRTP